MYNVEEMICPDFFDPEIYLQGTKESNAYGQKTVYHVVEAKRCNKTENAFCESEDNIDLFLSDKVLSLRYIQKSINFMKDDYVAYSSQMLSAFKLYGEFTDAGYRFRPNLFDRVNKWYWPFSESSVFYDLTFFNHHPFRINKKNIKTTLIAEIYYRVDTNLIEHQKYVTGFSDFLDSLAGMMGFLFEILTALVGSFIFWQQMTLRCFDLYTEETDPLRKTGLYTSGFRFYVRNFSAISFLFTKCNNNSEENKK